MEIFTKLGLNETLFLQMAVFLVVYVVLNRVLFKPYFAAYTERRMRTVGQSEAAERYVNEARELQTQYSAKAKQINEQFKAIYDKTRNEANKEYDRLIQEARAGAKEIVDQARIKTQVGVQHAKEQIKSEIPIVSEMITAKLLGSDKVPGKDSAQ
jgi:F-type H+-transporting ATPase subunit b